MERAQLRLRTLIVWGTVLGLFGLGICCPGFLGVSSGWTSVCHSGCGTGHCPPRSATECSRPALAAPDHAADSVSATETARRAATVPVASVLPEAVAPPRVSATDPSTQGHVRGGTHAVFLLHASFLL